MKNSRMIAALGGLLLASGGCFEEASNEYVPPPEAYHSPRSLNDVLKSERPQDFYAEAYGAFRFSSESVRTIPGAESPRTFQGSSALEYDDHGNFRLVRVPMSGEAPVELIRIDQKIYLKTGGESGFRVLRRQPEFQRWLTVSLREVFSIYDSAGFGKAASPTTKGSLSCWTEGDNTLCIDPESGLPIEGSAKVSVSGGELSVRFRFVPAKSDTIRVAPPA